MPLWKRLWAALPRLGIALLVIGFVVFIAFIGVVYYTGVFPGWTGFGPLPLDAQGKELPHEKTLWDWFDLLLVPLVLAIGGFFLTRSENRYALSLQGQREQEASLRAYLDQMTELLLHEKLRHSPAHSVRSVARARTLTVLRVLDGVRKAIVLQFLYEARLIGGLDDDEEGSYERIDAVVSLDGANLNEAYLVGTNLSWADLDGASLIGANLIGADLDGAFLSKTNLSRADLREASLNRANLIGANLDGADLREASLNRVNLDGANLTNCKITIVQLAQARSTEGTILPGRTPPASARSQG